MVLVKNRLLRNIKSVDSSVLDQVWIMFRNTPNVEFGFVSVPPSDSQYYCYDLFAAVRNKLSNPYCDTQHVITGDMNTRFGSAVRNILQEIEIPSKTRFSYPVIADDVNTANDNADIMSTLCI